MHLADELTLYTCHLHNVGFSVNTVRRILKLLGRGK